jgi:ABC-type transport system involved in multi-copper enzyme maturation permease subunit
MRQILAIFVDAYRELNARKVFWIVLLLSGLIAGIFGAIGMTSEGFSIFWWKIPANLTRFSPPTFYKWMFITFGINFWLQVPATGLALISTAGIFPELVSAGAIDLYLSKPIGRVRLFLAKYCCGLIFVALQVFCFCLAAFFVIGLRGGAWEPGIFIAVPLMVLFYSYLFSICTLVGVLTRSTVTAILVTLLFWGAAHFLQYGEALTAAIVDSQSQQRTSLDQRIEQMQKSLDELQNGSTATAVPQTQPTTEESNAFSIRLPALLQSAARFGASTPNSRQALEAELANRIEERSRLESNGVNTAHQVVYDIVTFLPKTTETVQMVQRVLIEHAGMTQANDLMQLTAPPPNNNNDPRQLRRQQQAIRGQAITNEMLTRPVWWVVGTSVGFEAVMLLLAGWIFCRRDY